MAFTHSANQSTQPRDDLVCGKRAVRQQVNQFRLAGGYRLVCRRFGQRPKKQILAMIQAGALEDAERWAGAHGVSESGNEVTEDKACGCQWRE